MGRNGGLRALAKTCISSATKLSPLHGAEKQRGCSTIIPVVLALTGIWALCTGQRESAATSRPYFPVPEKLVVKSTTLPTSTETVQIDLQGQIVNQTITYIEPNKVDFNQDFTLETDRYKIVKKSDWIATRWIGHVFSVFTKAFFWDARCGAGLDAEGCKNVIGMLERDTSVSGLTVRINHNNVWQDTGRALVDERASERNGFIPRLVYGMPGTFLGELLSELRRGDYYNPMTGTAVIYSDIPAIYAHEIGHHKDYARFSSDWLYSIVGKVPFVVLYPEWQASSRARDELLPPELRWQFTRYLIPAYGTYILYSVGALAKRRKDNEHDDD